jgi:hypothetical protein
MADVGQAAVAPEPTRAPCLTCGEFVLVACLTDGEGLPIGPVVVASAWEWEPRARCYVCAQVETRGKKRERCDRCAGTGYVGEVRPKETMLAVDVAWSDGGHVRLVTPAMCRRKGEALYALHDPEHSVIMPANPTREMVAA